MIWCHMTLILPTYVNSFKRDGVKEVTFPKIHLCLNSAHSAEKLRWNWKNTLRIQINNPFRRFYPEIDDKRIMQFYGVSGMAMTKELWNKLVISKLVSKIGQPWKAGLPIFWNYSLFNDIQVNPCKREPKTSI